MANGEDRIRDFIRLIPPARSLKDNLEESIHMERYAGVGDPAIKLYQGLYTTIASLTNDPYVATLALDIPADATDETKVSFVHLTAGQLVAFLEGQTGLVGVGSGSRTINLAPKVEFEGPVNQIASEALLNAIGQGTAKSEPTD
jgi:hypothetical protein